MKTLYKVLWADEWDAAATFAPLSPIDLKDGFVHLSTPAQVLETAALYFVGERGVLALEIAEADLAPALKYEPAPRRGALFPHYYGQIPRSVVRRVRRLERNAAGAFQFTDDLT